MKVALTLQKSNYLLAGIVAFMFLLLTQISVQAYDFAGGWARVKTIGTTGEAWLTIGTSNSNPDLNIGIIEQSEMPTVVTGAVSIAGGGQATLNGNVSNTGVASTFYRFFEYWGEDGVHHTTTESTGSAIGSFSDTVEDISTIGGFSYRAGVRVGSVYTYGSTSTLTTPYTGANTILLATPLLIWIALIITIIYLFASGAAKFKAGDTPGGQTYWIMAVVAIVVNVLLFPIVLDTIAALLGA